jgi:hypothetical protein
MHSPTYIILGFLIPQTIVCTAAVIFFRKSHSLGAIVFLAGLVLVLTSITATILCPVWNQYYGFSDFSYRLWWVLRTGFSYTGTNLYAIGLLMIAVKQRKTEKAQQIDGSDS